MPTPLLLSKKLEIGCGERPKDGYSHLDVLDIEGVDYVWDATKTPYPFFKDGELEEIYSHWFLEHISSRDIDRLLSEWYRILKVGGVVNSTTNNYEAHNKALSEGTINWEEWMRMIFGIKTVEEMGKYEPVNVFECHKTAWNEKLVIKKFTKAGFKDIKVNLTWKHREDNGQIKCPGLIITAIK